MTTFSKNPITLEGIVNLNLEMLESQQAELEKALKFVKKAKSLLGKHSRKSPTKSKQSQKRVGRPRKKVVTKKAITPKKPIERKNRRSNVGGHLTAIASVLKKENKPMGTSQVIQSMFENQKKVKDKKLFSQRLYPVFTQAVKAGILVKKDGKVQLPQ